MAEKTKLTFREKTQVLNWLQNNLERIKPMSAEKAALVCKSEIGVVITAPVINGIARAVDLPVFTRHSIVRVKRVPKDRYDTFACLARAIKDIHEQHGTVSSEQDNLTHIVGRYLDNVK